MAGFADDRAFDLADVEIPDGATGPRLRTVLHPEDGSEPEDGPYTDEQGRVIAKYTLGDHLWEYLLEEEGFKDGKHFSYQAASEAGKRPDFLFPSAAAYGDPRFPADRLRMLAVKTTCRDRWRQILNEAGRLGTKHLLTLQEGVSRTQYLEMRNAGVRLVVPASIHRSYGPELEGEILSFQDFVEEVGGLV